MQCLLIFKRKLTPLWSSEVSDSLITDSFQSDRCYMVLLLSHLFLFFFYYLFRRTFLRFCSFNNTKEEMNITRKAKTFYEFKAMLPNYYLSVMFLEVH